MKNIFSNLFLAALLLTVSIGGANARECTDCKKAAKSSVVKSKAGKKGAAAATPGQPVSPAAQQPAAANIASGAIPVVYVCRNCGAQFNSLTAFCPNCVAHASS